MTPDERAVLAAIGVYAQRVREYNSIVDRPGFCDFRSREYIEAAHAMEAAHDAVMAAADVLHGAAPSEGRRTPHVQRGKPGIHPDDLSLESHP